MFVDERFETEIKLLQLLKGTSNLDMFNLSDSFAFLSVVLPVIASHVNMTWEPREEYFLGIRNFTMVF